MHRYFLILFLFFFEINSKAQAHLGYLKKEGILLDSSGVEIEAIKKGEAVFIFSIENNPKKYFVNHIKTNKEGFVSSKSVYVTSEEHEIKENIFSTIKDSEEKDPLVRIHNSTQKIMTLKLNNAKYEIPPKETLSLSLKSGICAFVVTAPEMLPHYGRENLAEFKMYEWEFYIE